MVKEVHCIRQSQSVVKGLRQRQSADVRASVTPGVDVKRIKMQIQIQIQTVLTNQRALSALSAADSAR